MAAYGTLADILVTFHLCYVAFTVGGEILILLGAAFRWGWVRNLIFRIVHLAACVLVAVEAVAGALCPLTTWEYRLRGLAGQHAESQIPLTARLVRSVIFYDFPWWVFTAAYIGFGLIVALTFILIRPRLTKTPRSSKM
jgi:hypothetical protein